MVLVVLREDAHLLLCSSGVEAVDTLQIMVHDDSLDKGTERNGGVTNALLAPGVDVTVPNKRYAVSEWAQFWIILKRAFLFSRRDWVR